MARLGMYLHKMVGRLVDGSFGFVAFGGALGAVTESRYIHSVVGVLNLNSTYLS